MLRSARRQAVQQFRQLKQVTDPEPAPPCSHHHKEIRLDGIGPPGWQRALHPRVIQEEDTILRPGLTDREEHELPAPPRMERVRHPNSSLTTDGIRSSRRCWTTRWPSPRSGST